MRLKNLIIIIVIAIIVGGVILFVTFNGETAPGIVIDLKIGEVLPTKLPKNLKKITMNMTSAQMFLVALENYYLTEYAAAFQNGTVTTNVGPIKQEQMVTARRIRKGIPDGFDDFDEPNHLPLDNDCEYYLDAYTSSIGSSVIDIRQMEETYMKWSGQSESWESLAFRNANKSNIGIDTATGLLAAKKYNKKVDYSDLVWYLMDHANDPTKIFMYNVDEDSILTKESTKPVLSEDGLTYSFKIVLDPELSTDTYLPVVRYMLEASGQGDATVKFTKMELEVVIWKNNFRPLIKTIQATEGYEIKTMGLTGDVSLDSMNYYSYNPKEEGMQIDTFRKAIMGK